MLTQSMHINWAMMMEVAGVWDTIEDGVVSRKEDKKALTGRQRCTACS
jgi:hypothetical protein